MSELEWDGYTQPGSDEAYVAFTKRSRYLIYQWKDGWDVSRMDHPLMPPFDGACPTLKAAKRACDRDYLQLARADRWLDYMLGHEPPEQP